MEVLAILIIFGSIALYFLPCIVAYNSDHKNSTSIFVLNLLLGWTFIGWVVALVWAFKKD